MVPWRGLVCPPEEEASEWDKQAPPLAGGRPPVARRKCRAAPSKLEGERVGLQGRGPAVLTGWLRLLPESAVETLWEKLSQQ